LVVKTLVRIKGAVLDFIRRKPGTTVLMGLVALAMLFIFYVFLVLVPRAFSP
jgi:hypothetical protein